MLKERGNLASSRNRTLLIINKQWSVMLQEGLQLGLVLYPGGWVVMGWKKEKAGLSLNGDQKLTFLVCCVSPACPLPQRNRLV